MVFLLLVFSLRRILNQNILSWELLLAAIILPVLLHLAVLEVIEEEKLMGNATMVGKYLRDELEAIPELKNVRGRV